MRRISLFAGLLGAWLAAALPSYADVPAACSGVGAKDKVHPLADTHQIPPYPDISQRLGEQGTTVMQVLVDKFGVPLTVTLKSSSGSPRLDDAAMLKVKEDWRWQPLTGECAESGIEAMVQVRWNLTAPTSETIPHQEAPLIYAEPSDYPDAARNLKEEGVTTVAVTLSDQGAVFSTMIVRSSGFDDLDAVALQIAARQKFQSPQVNGISMPAITGLNIAFVLKGRATPQPAH